MKSSQTGKQLAGLVLIIFVLVACKSLQSLGKPKVVKSKDGKFQLTVPADWIEAPTLNAQADLGAKNVARDVYAFVLTESKKELTPDMTLDRFTEITRERVMEKLTTTESPAPEHTTVNGYDARRYRLVGARDNLNVVYFITTVETPDHLHQVFTWTDPRKRDKNEAELLEVADSFRSVE